jgi:carboxymethylenebutenolidase
MCQYDECGTDPGRRAFLKHGLALGAVGLAGPAAAAADSPPQPVGDEIVFPSSVGPVRGYLALPAGTGRQPAVVVQHGEIGLPLSHRQTADELAQAGFAALVVQRFSRLPGITAEQIAADGRGARHFLSESFFRESQEEARGAVDHLLAHTRVRRGRIGAIGFCGGGIQAVRLAIAMPVLRAVVSFYGPPALPSQYRHPTDPIVNLVDIAGRIRRPLQIHYGTRDYAVRAEDVDRLVAAARNAGAHVEAYAYQGATHAFYDRTNQAAFNPAAAALARVRYVAFLDTWLRG